MNSLKTQTHLCWKFEARVCKNISDNRKITAAVQLKFIIHGINLLGLVHKIDTLYVTFFKVSRTLHFVHIYVKYLW